MYTSAEARTDARRNGFELDVFGRLLARALDRQPAQRGQRHTETHG
jgi:hypothetical protein